MLLTGTLQACVGPSAGIELKAFIDSLDQMPDLDAITRGEDIKAPKEIDLQYAVASALVGRAIAAKDKEHAEAVFGNILNYAKAFRQKEMGVMLVSDMLRAVGDELFEVPAFAHWAASIGDILLYD
jgi:hypothetical protein